MPGVLMLGLSLAQALSGPPAAANELARIRNALAEPPPLVAPPLATPAREGLVFRATVYGRNPDRPIWEEWSAVPSYIRPNMPLYHYQFMQVTPEEFRGGTFAPVGFPVGSFIEWLAKGFAAENRKTHESRARKEVRKALEEVLACRADPSRPGC